MVSVVLPDLLEMLNEAQSSQNVILKAIFLSIGTKKELLAQDEELVDSSEEIPLIMKLLPLT